MNHNVLLDSLACEKEAIFKDIPLGSVWGAQDRHRKKTLNKINNGDWSWEELRKPANGIPRADVLVIKPSFTSFCIDIFEIKAQRADFLSDIRTEKWKKYLPFCHRFYFAVFDSVATKKEIPEGVGLYEFGRIRTRSWSLINGATKRDIELDYEFLLSLIFYKQQDFFWYKKKIEVIKGALEINP